MIPPFQRLFLDFLPFLPEPRGVQGKALNLTWFRAL